jgi:hypothetical protein
MIALGTGRRFAKGQLKDGRLTRIIFITLEITFSKL